MRKIASQRHRPADLPAQPTDYATLRDTVRKKLAQLLVDRWDHSQPIDELRRDLRPIVEQLVDTTAPLLNRIEREKLVNEVVDGIR
ncbi:MAG: hypothetical protein ACRCZF_11180 [Gemmataceae bacterium]